MAESLDRRQAQVDLAAGAHHAVAGERDGRLTFGSTCAANLAGDGWSGLRRGRQVCDCGTRRAGEPRLIGRGRCDRVGSRFQWTFEAS